jgi:ABC-type nitrate/sulfonate/bicarbonate transport system substrate-binding protein
VFSLLWIILLVLSSCPDSAPLTRYSLRVGIFYAADCLPYYVMRDRGLDKEFALDLQNTVYPGGAAMLKALFEGSLDLATGVGTSAVMASAENGTVPQKAVCFSAYGFFDKRHPSIALLEGTSFNTIKDLKGQLIGVNAKVSAGASAIVERLQHFGIIDYKLVEIDYVNMGLAVAGGNIAAAVMTEPFLTQSLLRKDGMFVDISESPFAEVYSTQLVRTDIFKNNPGAVKAFLGAHIAACKWIEKNPKQARSIVAKQLGITDEIAQKMNLLNWPADARNNPAAMLDIQPYLIQLGQIKGPIPPGNLFDETLLNEVLTKNN